MFDVVDVGLRLADAFGARFDESEVDLEKPCWVAAADGSRADLDRCCCC